MNQKLKINTYIQTRDMSCEVVPAATIKPDGFDIKRLNCDTTDMICTHVSVVIY
jgi:hypothetical protein